MACNTGICTPRDFSSSGFQDAVRFVQLGTPLTIQLDVNNPTVLKSCTSSFIAVEKSNNALVIVTIGHLLTHNPTITNDRTDPQNTVNVNLYFDNQSYPYSKVFALPNLTNVISQMSMYNALYTKANSGQITYNQVNAGMTCPMAYWFGSNLDGSSTSAIYCNSTFDSNNRVGWQNSYVQCDPVLYNSVKLTEPMPFATTAELDTITPSTEIMIVGHQQLKKGDCGVKIDSVNDTHDFTFENVVGQFAFNHLLSFTRIDPSCGNPVIDEDRGATIAAYIGGKWKIIGIVIGFNGAVGYGSRIDYIADQLNIEAWDGSLKHFNNFYPYDSPGVRIAGMKFLTKPGLDNVKTFTETGIRYQQIGTSGLNLS